MRSGLIIFAVLLSTVAGYRPTNYLSTEQKFQTSPLTPAANGIKDANDLPTNTKETTIEASSPTTTTTAQAKPAPGTTTVIPTQPTVLLDTTLAPTASSGVPSPETMPPKDSSENLSYLSSPSTESQALAQEEDEEHQPDASKRRVVNYDQRQEGQYNIRADLENFMIVLIPPSAAGGLGLLDLLTKSATRHTSTKSKRKHYASSSASSSKPGASRYHQSLKAGGLNQNFNYLLRNPDAQLDMGHPSTVQRLAHSQHMGHGGQGGSRASDFIEGRTPYHVDISSNDEEQSRLHPEQVDVLPPPAYPYPHLIKPYYHLEAEPTVIQALPPPLPESEARPHTAATFLDSYNQLLAAGLRSNAGSAASSARSSNNVGSTDPNDGYYRVSRAVLHNDFLDTNRVNTQNGLHSYGVRRTSVPIYRSEYSAGAAGLYPPIDVPRYQPAKADSRSVTLESNDEDEIQNLSDGHVGEIIVPSFLSGVDDIDLDSSLVIDAQAKALLSDGIERCAPGRRRDSYGVCREIEGY